MQAARDAAMLAARAAGERWACPLPVLAEREGPDRIHVTVLSEGPLELAEAPVGTAVHHGFALRGQNLPAIRSVDVHPDDPRTVVLTLTGPSAGVAGVDYAVDGPGGLRDDWRGAFDNRPLCRWALPARLAVH
jgi:hypothetical protein